jgi:hypothetical protein
MERFAARAGIGSGVVGAGANILVIAYFVLLLARPGDVQSGLGQLAGLLGGISAALMVPLAVGLGSSGVASLGIAAMVALAGVWWLVAARAVPLIVATPVVLLAALALATWLLLVCDQPTVPPRASRVGRRIAAFALLGTLVVTLALALMPAGSTNQVIALLVGGVPAAVAWLTVPAWSLRVGRWLSTGPEWRART